MKLGIVAPCYNEHEVLVESAGRLTVLMDDLVAKKKIDADSFILFVNDGSRDNTWEIISHLFEVNPYVYGVNLAGNVGHQHAIMAGMMTAKDMCDAVITIDADLQDDLKAIEEMVDRYNEGYEFVYGVEKTRGAGFFFKRKNALGFFKIERSFGGESHS